MAVLGFYAGDPEFPVTPPLIGPVSLISQGWFEEPVCPSSHVFVVVSGLVPVLESP